MIAAEFGSDAKAAGLARLLPAVDSHGRRSETTRKRLVSVA
jgi:hypothetical protein